MQTPVCCADGNVYDKVDIQRWFARGHSTSPLTNAVLPHLGLLYLPAVKHAIDEFLAWKNATDKDINGEFLGSSESLGRLDGS